MGKVWCGVSCATLMVLVATPAAAATGGGLPAALGLPFAGLLLSIAVLPLVRPALWHHHYGKIALAWSLLALAGLFALEGGDATIHRLIHTLIGEYIPFIVLVGTLFVVSGGLLVTGNIHGSPVTNAGLLLLGTVLASFIGTTGASMVLIRPLIRANDARRHNAHVVIFFIFLVSNIGGSLTPLGDPPLFLGFLQGVGFFWTTTHLLPATATAVAILLAIFIGLDTVLYRRDARFRALADPTPDSRAVGLEGLVNLGLLAVVIAAVLMSGVWRPGVTLAVYGTEIALQDLLRDGVLLIVAVASMALTPARVRADNGFTFDPIREVAKLFAGIFVTMIPVLAILKSGRDGAFSGLVALTTDAAGKPIDAAYFWLTGILSSFLDNAPTYLVFFNLAGGDATALQGPLAATLAAISAGAVFMGANSYIGNAPNFMVKAIAEERGVRMPGFFGYMAWSGGILVPVFLVLTVIFFR